MNDCASAILAGSPYWGVSDRYKDSDKQATPPAHPGLVEPGPASTPGSRFRQRQRS